MRWNICAACRWIASDRFISPATPTRARTCSTRTIIRCRTACGRCIARRCGASAKCRRWWSGTITFRNWTSWSPRAAKRRRSKRRSMRLADVQALFWEALQGGEPAVEQAFRGTPELPARARVQIYSDMVLWRQIDVLREDFPKLETLLGDEEFAELAEAYVRRWPSEYPSLVRLGRKMAEFI